MDLYALPPEEFTAARDAAAKQDKSLKALRKPTVSAWVVNTLVRREALLLDQLITLGVELGAAQLQRDPAALRTLGDQRRQLVGAVTQRAVELADREVTSAVRLEVEATLEAALADPASAEAVRSGQLVRALSFAGFGGVDLDGAVAELPAAPKARSPKADEGGTGGKAKGAKAKGAQVKGAKAADAKAKAGPSKKVQRLEAAALEAQGALDDAVRHAERVVTDLSTSEQAEQQAQEASAAADAALDELRAAVAVAEKAAGPARSSRSRASKEADELRRKAERATRAVATAQSAADAARKALDNARRS